MEIVLSGVVKNFTLKENVFDCAGRLACRALGLLFLLEYKRVHQSAVTNKQSRKSLGMNSKITFEYN